VEGLTGCGGRTTGAARVLAAAAAGFLAACASRVEAPTVPASAPTVRLQSSSLAPGNGGELVAPSSLATGDILLSSVGTLQSLGIQLATLAPVSHALVYVGDGRVAEAVGDGVGVRDIDAVLGSEQMVVAFRDPQLTPEQAAAVRRWALAQVGTPYNTVGVVLSAPFVVNRRLCEVPLVPGPLRDACIRGVASVQLGASRDDRFFCSQFVLEAYRQAGAPLSDADPRWVSPADLLHMREGDVATFAPARPLRYVGHLKYTPPRAVVTDAP
jgi:cell wall-associated NlpC family hydrolase